ncbi:MAG: hypothetical protein ABII26_08775 [Pseudomonadota bacterium]
MDIHTALSPDGVPIRYQGQGTGKPVLGWLGFSVQDTPYIATFFS